MITTITLLGVFAAAYMALSNYSRYCPKDTPHDEHLFGLQHKSYRYKLHDDLQFADGSIHTVIATPALATITQVSGDAAVEEPCYILEDMADGTYRAISQKALEEIKLTRTFLP